MGMIELLGAIVSILAALLPVFLVHISEEKQQHDDLTRRSLDELHAGTDRVRPPPQPPV